MLMATGGLTGTRGGVAVVVGVVIMGLKEEEEEEEEEDVVSCIGCWATNEGSLLLERVFSNVADKGFALAFVATEAEAELVLVDMASGFFEVIVTLLLLLIAGGVDDERWKGRRKKRLRFDSGLTTTTAGVTAAAAFVDLTSFDFFTGGSGCG